MLIAIRILIASTQLGFSKRKRNWSKEKHRKPFVLLVKKKNFLLFLFQFKEYHKGSLNFKVIT